MRWRREAAPHSVLGPGNSVDCTVRGVAESRTCRGGLGCMSSRPVGLKPLSLAGAGSGAPLGGRAASTASLLTSVTRAAMSHAGLHTRLPDAAHISLVLTRHSRLPWRGTLGKWTSCLAELTPRVALFPCLYVCPS